MNDWQFVGAVIAGLIALGSLLFWFAGRGIGRIDR
jgi:hypothetical protein